MESKLTFGSLFAGIGGGDKGLEDAGMVCKWQVEQDDFCNKVLEKHWPNVPRYKDVRNCGRNNLERVDVIIGGFPCQGFSQAGKRKGKEDDRYLWPEMLRIIQELRPTWVIGENVAGIIKLALDEVLVTLESSKYSARTFAIPAVAVDAPHKRERIWIVAHSTESGPQRPKRKKLQGNSNRLANPSNSMANTNRSRKRHGRRGREICNQQRYGQKTKQKRDKFKPWSRTPSKYVADTSRKLRYRSWETGTTGWPKSSNSRRRKVEPRVCGMVNGLSQGLDKNLDYSWPAEDYSVPRTVTSAKNRVNRLKTLGNSMVPALVQVIGEAVIQANKKGP